MFLSLRLSNWQLAPKAVADDNLWAKRSKPSAKGLNCTLHAG